MSKRSLWRAGLVALVLLLVAAPGVLAAPADQESPPADATPTAGEASGEVEARVLIVRAGASTDWNAIGGLDEGQMIRVKGVSPDGRWLLIEWEGGEGWVAADYVSVNSSGDLPVAAPPTAQPRLIDTPTLTPSSTPTPDGTSTNTPTPTRTESPTETATPSPEPTLTATPTEAEAEAAVAPIEPEGDSEVQVIPTPVGPQGVLSGLNMSEQTFGLLAVVAAALLLGLVVILAQRGRRRRELNRYAGGFVLDECPVCQQGHLHLEEIRQRTGGVTTIRRTVRCDRCRSVLRQVQPGRWRYTIDPLVNPELAEAYNGHDFTDAGLAAFAESAQTYAPRTPEPEPEASPEFQETVEYLSALEASILNGDGLDGEEAAAEDGEVAETAEVADAEVNENGGPADEAEAAEAELDETAEN